jgi:hypothetical protein
MLSHVRMTKRVSQTRPSSIYRGPKRIELLYPFTGLSTYLSSHPLGPLFFTCQSSIKYGNVRKYKTSGVSICPAKKTLLLNNEHQSSTHSYVRCYIHNHRQRETHTIICLMGPPSLELTGRAGPKEGVNAGPTGFPSDMTTSHGS